MLEEKSKLLLEVERSREEEEKSKKVMESLVLVLYEVLCEVCELRDLKFVMKVMSDKYEEMFEEVR